MNRIIQFDYIRVLSSLGILLCHSAHTNPNYGWLGWFLGSTFNFLFLILSAFLLGMVWEKKGYESYGLGFLTKRIVRLSKSYYTFLVILFVFLYFNNGEISLRHIISHFAYLPWFDKIHGYGHLWFITMIIFCYLGCYALSKVYSRLNLKIKNVLLLGLLLGSFGLDYLCKRYNLPGYLFPYLIGYLFVFCNANKIIKLIKLIKLPYSILQFVIIISAGLFLFFNNYFNILSNNILTHFIGILCAISTFVFLFNTIQGRKESKVVVWLSGISFEIYLVHEFFLNEYCIYKYTSPFIGYLLLILGSIGLAYLVQN